MISVARLSPIPAVPLTFFYTHRSFTLYFLQCHRKSSCDPDRSVGYRPGENVLSLVSSHLIPSNLSLTATIVCKFSVIVIFSVCMSMRPQMFSKRIKTNVQQVKKKKKRKKERNTPIYFNTNNRTEMKPVPIIMDYCLLQFDALRFSQGSAYMGGH